MNNLANFELANPILVGKPNLNLANTNEDFANELHFEQHEYFYHGKVTNGLPKYVRNDPTAKLYSSNISVKTNIPVPFHLQNIRDAVRKIVQT